MKESTKNLIYTLLDVIDVLQKSNVLIGANSSSILEAKEELFGLLLPPTHIISEPKIKDYVINLIGLLPSLLIDKTKFPTNGDLVKFAEKSLNISVPSWEKKKREEIIGRIVYIIAEKSPLELQKFIEPWEKFNNKENKTNIKNVGKKTNFVDIWLEFFENYNK